MGLARSLVGSTQNVVMEPIAKQQEKKGGVTASPRWKIASFAAGFRHRSICGHCCCVLAHWPLCNSLVPGRSPCRRRTDRRTGEERSFALPLDLNSGRKDACCSFPSLSSFRPLLASFPFFSRQTTLGIQRWLPMVQVSVCLLILPFFLPTFLPCEHKLVIYIVRPPGIAPF